jgi:hypothetical protein
MMSNVSFRNVSLSESDDSEFSTMQVRFHIFNNLFRLSRENGNVPEYYYFTFFGEEVMYRGIEKKNGICNLIFPKLPYVILDVFCGNQLKH